MTVKITKALVLARSGLVVRRWLPKLCKDDRVLAYSQVTCLLRSHYQKLQIHDP